MKRISEKGWKRRVDSWEFALGQGRQQEVREALLDLDGGDIPLSSRARIGNLAWRTDLPGVGAAVLHPVVRGSVEPGAAQAAEYAACLVRLGGGEEAEALLEGISPNKTPRALLYLAFAHASQWNYSGAAECLSRFLKINSDPIQRTVALLNLAAALIHELRLDPAITVLEEILTEAPRSQHLIRTAGSHLYAAVLILQGEEDEADDFLAHAQKQLSTRVSGQDFLIRKWRAVAGVRANPDETALAKLIRIRGEARDRKEYETARYADRVLAVATGDRDLFHYLYFGTPYPAFRTALLREFGPMEVPPVFLWQEGDDPPVDAFGLWGEEPLLDPTKLAFPLLAALSEDFYGPRSVAALYPALVPGGKFDPEASPKKVAEAVRRLRVELVDMDADVIESEGKYRLMLRGESLLVPRPRSDRPPIPLALLPFFEERGKQAFGVEDVGKHLGTSPAGAGRVLELARQMGGVRPVPGQKKQFEFAVPGGTTNSKLKSVP